MDEAGTGVTDQENRPARGQSVSDYRLEQVEIGLKEFRTEIKSAIDSLRGTYVTTELYNADKAGNNERHIRTETDVAALQADAIERDKFARGVRVQGAIAAVASIIAIISLVMNIVR